jgi:hypothetical protein
MTAVSLEQCCDINVRTALVMTMAKPLPAPSGLSAASSERYGRPIAVTCASAMKNIGESARRFRAFTAKKLDDGFDTQQTFQGWLASAAEIFPQDFKPFALSNNKTKANSFKLLN